MILGLAGLKGAGKDTAAAYLIKQHSFERRAFADPLKRSVAALFDIPFSDVDRHKNDSSVQVELQRLSETGFPMSGGASFSFREFLQRYGTESHRDVFGENFWIDQTLPIDGFYSGRKIVITDVRFRNEAERIKFLPGGVVVRIDRGIAADPVLDSHRSEQIGFVPNFILRNNGTIEELYDEIEKLLEAAHDRGRLDRPA